MHLRRPYSPLAVAALVVATLSYAAPARAQDTTAAPGTHATQPPPDMPAGKAPAAESDLMLIDLPTTLSLKRHHSYFRLTHRFARDLRRGDLGELASDLFSLDNGAIIGFEYRFGITSTIQAGVHRSMLSKTVQTFGRWDGVAQGTRSPIGASLTLSVEGLDNMQQDVQPAVAITVSRIVGDRLAVYATPAFVGSTRAVDVIEGHDDHDHATGLEDEHSNHDDTWLLGLGGRLRFSDTGYLVGEYTPRLGGYDPNRGTWGVALERVTGGHVLQLNLTNSFGTTFGQLARGGSPHDIYLGFNLTRKF